MKISTKHFLIDEIIRIQVNQVDRVYLHILLYFFWYLRGMMTIG